MKRFLVRFVLVGVPLILATATACVLRTRPVAHRGNAVVVQGHGHGNGHGHGHGHGHGKGNNGHGR